MIAGASPEVLDLAAGRAAVLDGRPASSWSARGRWRTPPGRPTPSARPARRWPRATEAQAGGPARTADGRQIVVLCNVASAVETRRGLAAGADGVGLLRTELPYVQAADWPTLEQDRAQLGPILELLAGKTATVRVLDFSGDKIPPFLATGAYWGRSDVEASGEIGAGWW